MEASHIRCHVKTVIVQMILFLLTSVLSHLLENSVWELQRQQQNLAGRSGQSKQRTGISRELYKLYCTKMKIGVTSKNCSICFGKLEKGDIINQLPCKHIFHSSCIKPWLKQSAQCPNCRFDIKKHHSALQ